MTNQNTAFNPENQQNLIGHQLNHSKWGKCKIFAVDQRKDGPVWTVKFTKMLEEKDEKTGKPILDKDGKPKKKEETFEKKILAYYAISKGIASLDDEKLNSLVKYHADNFLAVQEEAERKSTPRPQHLCVLDVVPDAMGTGRQIVAPRSEVAKHPEPAKKNNIAQSPDLNFVPDIEPIDVKKVS